VTATLFRRRIHALQASGGKTYAQLAPLPTADGAGTGNKAAAPKAPQRRSSFESGARPVDRLTSDARYTGIGTRMLRVPTKARYDLRRSPP